MTAHKAHFRPEFINRIDDTVIFDALTRENMDAIFTIQMKRVQRLLDERQLLVEVTSAAQTALCDAGFDPTFGARPLKRAIQQYLLNPMSKAIVSGGYGPKDTIKIEWILKTSLSSPVYQHRRKVKRLKDMAYPNDKERYIVSTIVPLLVWKNPYQT